MNLFSVPNIRTLLGVASLCFVGFVSGAFGQEQKQGQSPEQRDDVVRVSTELIQTGVMVFDREGRFVDGLQKDQFDLRVDAKPVPVAFFERVVAGSVREQAVLATARGTDLNASKSTVPDPSTRGRAVVFFIDDLHLSLTSLGRTRAALLRFIDDEMKSNDQTAIVSASGQIGFLQQFTDNKNVLRAAVARLNHVPYTVPDTESPPMTEYLAIRIENNDREAIDYYVDEIIKSFNSKNTKGINLAAAAEMVKNRARQIVLGSESVTANTLASLESLMHSSSQMPGRKLVFFISDGFYLDSRKTGSSASDMLRRVTNAATTTGAVIYTIDARGLISGQPDATNERPFDPTGRLDRANVGETSISQDGLNALAGDTGGRALRNTNALEPWVTGVLDETSNYYLLAWRPEHAEQKGGKFKRIEVRILGRPDLSVRLPRGYFEANAKALAARGDAKTSTPGAGTKIEMSAESSLRAALAAFSPTGALPLLLSASFLDVPNNGLVLTSSVQVATGALTYGPDGKQPAAVDIAGVALNDRGKLAASFKTRLSVNPVASDSASSDQSGVIYNHRAPLAPGIYQLKVAARDDKSGRVGSAMQWIEIPNLSTRQLTLSSLLLGGQHVVGAAGKKEKDDGASQVQFSVDRRFGRTSRLNFLIFIYNAARGGGGRYPAVDLMAQVQVFRNGQAVLSTAQRKLPIEEMTDLARVPYGGEFALNSLGAGHYALEVTITDRIAKTSAAQRVGFEVK